MKLPTLEENHYSLISAEQMNKKFPDTFWIPSKERRENLSKGDIVKIIFEMESIEDPKELNAERMWVIITEKSNAFYVGKLDSFPFDNVHIKYGQRVNFKPEHIIDIC